MKSSKSNKELLLLLKEDNEIAFYNIYERYCKRLYAFVYSYIKIDSETEEIVQEIFVKIWESRHDIDVFSSFESYIFTIAYNATISLFRKKATEKKYIEYLKSFQSADDVENLEGEIFYNELNEKIRSLLDNLTSRQKEVFLLSREQGLSNADIAKQLKITVNTVKKHISNTLVYLKNNLDKNLIFSVLFFFLFLE